MTVQKLFLSFLGTGFSPKQPAAAAMLLALLIGVVVLSTLGMETLFLLSLAVIVIGIFEINKLGKNTEEEALLPPESIVIDKVPGIWFAEMIALSTASTMTYPYADVLAILFAFASFYLFHTWKPSTIGWISREVKGGLGMMMDDLLAGIAGGLLSVVILMGIEKLF